MVNIQIRPKVFKRISGNEYHLKTKVPILTKEEFAKKVGPYFNNLDKIRMYGFDDELDPLILDDIEKAFQRHKNGSCDIKVVAKEDDQKLIKLAKKYDVPIRVKKRVWFNFKIFDNGLKFVQRTNRKIRSVENVSTNTRIDDYNTYDRTLSTYDYDAAYLGGIMFSISYSLLSRKPKLSHEN